MEHIVPMKGDMPGGMAGRVGHGEPNTASGPLHTLARGMTPLVREGHLAEDHVAEQAGTRASTAPHLQLGIQSDHPRVPGSVVPMRVRVEEMGGGKPLLR